ncbi:hypothetical protein GXW83_23720 [Streptacidiphilus sp. PB12-B1b]|nr:condensation domain-containing protein [Streptacidiphilus sp. PB12-B1b]QMU78262.1 hypothetical protein GXW83_23720 [Streptacidiphilus sp. PB12-B1b]
MTATRAGRVDPVRLGFAQQAHLLGLAARAGSRTPVYFSYEIRGDLDPTVFVRAVRQLVVRHDALRLELAPVDGGAHGQRDRGVPEGPLVRLQAVRSNSPDQFHRFVTRTLANDALGEWRLDHDRPFRFRLIRFSGTRHAFLASFSHLAVDGRSCAILMRDLWSAYAELLAARPSSAVPGPTASTPFLDAVEGQWQRFGSRAVAGNADYWRRRIASMPNGCDFVTASAAGPPAEGTAGAALRQIQLSGDDLSRFRDDCDSRGRTTFQAVLAIFAEVVFGLTRQNRIAVHVPVDTRLRSEQDIVGMFAINLPVVLDRPSAEGGSLLHSSAAELLNAVSRRHVDGRALVASQQELSRGPGTGFVRSLALSYASYFEEGVEGTLPLVLLPGAYQLDLAPSTPGIDVRVDEQASAIVLSVVANSGVFGQGDLDGIMDSVERALRCGWVRRTPGSPSAR